MTQTSLEKARWDQSSVSTILENPHTDIRTSTSPSASADTSHYVFFPPASVLVTKHYSLFNCIVLFILFYLATLIGVIAVTSEYFFPIANR